MRSSRFRTLLLAGCAGVALSPAFALAQTAPQARTTYNIPAQDLGTALTQFGQQSEREIVFSADLTRNRHARAVSGEMTATEALAMLLSDSGLTYRSSPNGSIIVEASDPQSGSAAGDGADGTVQALVVTAQKREENIQDVPIAMSAFTQEDLTRSQVAGGPDLMTQVPNFTFTKTNFSSYSIQIRGIGTQAISATTDAAVAVAENNTPFIRNRFFEQEFYDLERVEVLRGPQGTLYGRNATAGVVNIITAKPKFTYDARLSLDLGNYNSHRLEGMLNIPLVDDKVALRIAGAWTKRDGYDTNQITGNRIDGRDLWSTRLSLRVAPTDKIDVNLIWEHFNEDDDRLRSGKQLCKRHQPETIAGRTVPWGQMGPGSNNGALYDEYFSQGCEAASLYSPDSFQAPNGLRLPYYRALSRLALPIVTSNPDGTAFDPYASTTQSRDLRVIESTIDPIYRAKNDTLEIQAKFDLSDTLTLTSETGYGVDEIFSSQDYNRFNTRPGAFTTFGPVGQKALATGIINEDGTFCDPQIGCANRLVAMDLSTAKSRQFSQELRLASDYDGPFNFSLGANFLRYDTMEKYYVFINTLSLFAATRPMTFGAGDISTYVPGVSDNQPCLPSGLAAPDPNAVQPVLECVYIDPNPITSLNDLGHNYFLSKNPYKLISYAVFGEAYYQITNSLKLTAGLRWTVDKKDAPRIPSWVLGANTAGYPVAEVVKQEWREPTGRLTLDWKPDLAFTNETLLYASYAHGYKAGGANPPAAGLVMYGQPDPDWGLVAAQQAALAPRRFNPEFVDAFEVGAKNTFLDGRATLNAAAFYYDYQGYQISQIVNRAATNLNFDAKVWGLELEADWRPLDNLRLGFKGGYENTRMADGSRAIDTMDRTAGNPDWFVSAPFPTLPGNCILPTSIVERPNNVLGMIGLSGGGYLTACEYAYVLGVDPVTLKPYVPNPPNPSGNSPDLLWFPGYKGFDPHTAPNGGAGFYKDLSGNDLPNAPHFTATLTADYTLPLPNDWLMTLHTDLYYQSEAWTRVFNTPGYDKLKAYNNVNLAAIFANEDAGWQVMAYVKNVFNKDNITGAFLNSDDTGLTTNVFLNEPRLYGLRVSKEFTGGPWWTGASANHAGPYPLTLEVSGQVQRNKASYENTPIGWMSDLPQNIQLSPLAKPKPDVGDGRTIKLTYQPAGSPWFVAAAYRYGRMNRETVRAHRDVTEDLKVCAWPASLYYGYLASAFCDPASPIGGGAYYNKFWANYSAASFADASSVSREEHNLVDFEVGREVGIGSTLASSRIAAGLRYAEFQRSGHSSAAARGNWNVPDGWRFYDVSNHRYEAHASEEREFKGLGPVLSWHGAVHLIGNEESGHLDVDWGVTGGVLFGKQKVALSAAEQSAYYKGTYTSIGYGRLFRQGDPVVVDTSPAARSNSTSVPVLGLALGLAYDVGRIKVGTGYSWERYFNVLDTGWAEHKDADRTIDGPYFKIAVGFGG